MSNTVFFILILAAICHAVWNALARRVEERDPFFTLILGISLIIYLPVALYMWTTVSIPQEAYKWICLSIFLILLIYLF